MQIQRVLTFVRKARVLPCAIALVALVAVPGVRAQTVDTGQVALGQSTVEPAFNDANGSVIYLLTPDKSPFPSKANSTATAPLYLVVYPLNSTIDASTLNCTPTNCDHANVLPFPDPDYGALPGNSTACTDFNGGNPCSLVKGHDHLVGVPPTGDFNVAWSVKLVFFTSAGFADHAINTRVTTAAQIWALVQSGDAVVADTPIVFNCSRVSSVTYDRGTPVVINFP